MEEKKCEKTELWKDENGKEYDYCQEHICVLCCKSTITKSKHQIGNNNQGSFYYCHRKECSAKWKTIELKNEKARNKLINDRDPLLSKLKSDSLIAPEFLAELQPFLVSLWEQKVFLINSNFAPKPAFTADNLITIKGLIDGAGFLTNPEKEHLKQAYDQAAGNIDNTLNEVEGALTSIGRQRKIRHERANLVQQLENLAGWNLLNFTRRQYYLDQATKLDSLHFSVVLNQAREEIEKVKVERERERERERESKNNWMPGSWERKKE